jgi:hypothetical protein
MATYLNPNISKEGILAVGDNVLYTCPYNYRATLAAFKFNSPGAYDISLRIERSSPAATIVYYTFNLDAGDVMTDGGGYVLNDGDQIIVTTGSASVTYSYAGQVIPINVPRQP